MSASTEIRRFSQISGLALAPRVLRRSRQLVLAAAALTWFPIWAAVPNAPTNLVATSISSTQISLTWSDASSDESGFKIERSSDGSNFLQIAQILSNTVKYRDALAWPGAAYTYRVRAYNSGGASDYSAPAVVVSPALCADALVGWGGSAPATPNVTGIVALSAGGNDTLAVSSAGTVLGFGADDYGKATPPAGLTGVVAVAAGPYHSLALKGDGTVVGWGYNYSGEASPPDALSGAVAIAAGGAHSLALRSDGTVAGWGYNAYGQASPPGGLAGVVAISAGEEHSLALKSDGLVVAWGHDQFGQTSVPPGLTDVVAIAAGDWHSLALKADGTVVGWGYNYQGETNPPSGLSNVVAIGAGDYFSIALKNDGTIAGWGYPRATIPPAGLTGITSVAVGFGHCSALTCGPYAPSGLSVSSVTSNEVALAWVDNSQTEDGFRLERAADNNGSPGAWTQLAAPAANATSYIDIGVSPSTKYWYRLQAYNAGGGSAYATPVTVATPPLAPPTRLTAKALSSSQIQLTWSDNSATEDGFKVQRAPDLSGVPGTWSDLASLGAGATNYTDSGLRENTRYWYQVAAFDSSGSSPFSNQTNATTQIAAPSNLVATSLSTSQILLSWTDNSGVEDGFRIYRGRYSNDQYMVVETNAANLTAWSDTNVTCDTTWYYQVRAFKGQLLSSPSPYVSASTSTADTDGDGVCDCWMLKYFGHPTGLAADNSRASDDRDGDGMSNLQEFLAGTNPTNSQSALRITSTLVSTNGVKVTWKAVGGKQYAVQTNSVLTSAFTDASPVISIPGVSETTTNYLDVSVTSSAPSRFYRIRLVR